MPKNILIFSDGTGQAGGLRPDQRLSNIYKLYRATRVTPDNNIDPALQSAFYDAGLGTSENADPFWVRPISSARKLFASMTGSGISRNIADCYEALIERYEPGDRIFLFGFSRGGYTARCLAHVIALCGIPTRGGVDLPLAQRGAALRAIAEEAVFKVYDHATGKRGLNYKEERVELACRFRDKYASSDEEDDKKSNAAPYFIGVFDSVAAVGIRSWMRFAAIAVALGLTWAGSAFAGALSNRVIGWDEGSFRNVAFGLMIAYFAYRFFKSQFKFITNYGEKGRFGAHLALPRFSRMDDDTWLDPGVGFARHALAIDEFRYDFGRAKWGGSYVDADGNDPKVPRFRQIWFAGNHSDIGGSYPEDESRLSDIPLQWMVEQATSLPHPITVDWSKLNLFPDAGGQQHCEVKTLRGAFPGWWPRRLRFSWKSDVRWSASGATHHPSVEHRFNLSSIKNFDLEHPYRPAALIYHRGYAEACQLANKHCLPKDFDVVFEKVQKQWLLEDDKQTT